MASAVLVVARPKIFIRANEFKKWTKEKEKESFSPQNRMFLHTVTVCNYSVKIHVGPYIFCMLFSVKCMLHYIFNIILSNASYPLLVL